MFSVSTDTGNIFDMSGFSSETACINSDKILEIMPSVFTDLVIVLATLNTYFIREIKCCRQADKRNYMNIWSCLEFASEILLALLSERGRCVCDKNCTSTLNLIIICILYR
jgi:hypothetical protein